MSTIAEKRRFLIEMDIKVRTYDIDSAGHVSNIVYLRWMEDMRLEVLERYFPLKPLIDKGYQPIIASTFIEYKRPVKLFDKPRGSMWLSEIGLASYKFEGQVHLGEQLATHARHTGAFIDIKTGKPRRLPVEFVRRFEEAALT